MFKDNTQILLTRQLHEADRAGRHYDIRLVLGDKAYSWATKKDMPAEGEAIGIFEQPVHTTEYALRKRIVIPKGNYGSGTTTLDFVRKAVASNSDASKDKFVLTVPGTGERYLFLKMKKPGTKTWMLKRLPMKKEEPNKYLEKIANFRPKTEKKPNEVWKKDDDFKLRFSEMFDRSVSKRQMDAEKVKNYRWRNTLSVADDKGRLAKLLVPSKTDPGKHLTMTHPDYKKK